MTILTQPVARAAAAAGLAVCALAAGCSPRWFAGQADRAAYGLIRQKQRVAMGGERPFSISYRPILSARHRPAGQVALLDGKPIPVGSGPPRVLSLTEALRIAARNSRSFQTEKEDLYVQALELANLRHDWSLLDGQLTSAGDYADGPGRATRWDATGEGGLSFTQRFAAGGALTLAMGLDFASTFTGVKSTTVGSLLEANFTQPLLRGAFRRFAYEDLYRAERNLALAILTYERFVESFAVDIAADYYEVLRRRDQLGNERENLQRLELTYKFTQAQVKGGMLSRVQADQAEQNLLNARARVESARQDYEDALDEFKLTLGLSIAARVEPAPAELVRLQPLPIPMGEAEAVGTALRTRPDVLTTYAGLRDARRDVEIAADAFNPQLDLLLGVSATGTEPRKPFKVRFHDRTYSAGWTFDYGLDQTDNRDNYRLALIERNQAERSLEEFLDTVRLEVRQSYRSLVQSRRTHQIQTAAVALAKRRTKLAQLEQKEGLASTRDVLEAEDALRNSKNALTSALVNYVTTRLRFLATLGMIAVDAEGRFHERPRPQHLDRYRPDAPAGP